jgi:lipoprotein-anchoring transpeptidase ErfK/SrfK
MEPDTLENQPGSAESPPVEEAPAHADAGRHAGPWLGVLLAVLALAVAAAAGYLVVTARATGSGASLPLASVPGLDPQSPGATTAPQRPHWIVVRAQGRPVRVYDSASSSAKVIKTLPAQGPYNVPTVMLVRSEPTVIGSQTWYDVLLPTPPGRGIGWVKGSSVAMYVVYEMIQVNLVTHRLSVIVDNKVIREFPVAVGKPSTPTPTGTFFVTAKVNAINPNTIYGPLALALSAYSPALAGDFPPNGQVAIHGWTVPSVIGQAVSHGCVRMKIADMKWVVSHVSTGSPVVIGPPFK